MKHVVDRYIYQTDGRIDISHEGFLILNNYSFRYSDIVDVVELSGGILLGEGGMGKTTFLMKLHEDISNGSSCIFELGRHYRNDQQGLRKDVKAFRDSCSEGVQPTLIFDGYDEAPELSPSIARLIRDIGDTAIVWVGSRDIPAIRLIQDERQEFKAYKLAPLTESDIGSIAEFNGLDPSDFIRKIREKGITHICSKPLGCEFAVSSYLENKLEMYGMHDLWRLGTRRLCDENPSGTKLEPTSKAVPLDAIYESAKWIAICLEFTKSNSVWTGDTSHCPDDCLPAESLVFEELSTEIIFESLSRGVFTPLGDGRVQFAQPEYKDFLAAEKFMQSIPEVAWEPLLMTGDRSSVYPERHQIASWLSEKTGFLEVLLRTQPQLLIRNEIAISQIGADVICQRLLDHASNLSHRDTREENFSKYLFRLKTDQTSDILRKHLYSKARSSESVELAFQIIEKCSLSEVLDLVVNCMSQSELPLGVRKNASYCLANIGADLNEQILDTLKTFDYGDDTDDDIRGNLLRCLWPNHLTPEELLERLTPIKHKNYTGAYGMFIEFELPKSLEKLVSTEVAESVLKWTNNRLLKGEFSRTGNLARKIYSCYWRQGRVHSKKVASLLIEGYMLTLKKHSNPFAIQEYSEIPATALSYDEFKKDKYTRLSVLRMVVEDTDFDLDYLPNAAVTRYPLYTYDDFEDIIEFVLEATDREKETRWFKCFDALLSLEQAEQHAEDIDRLHDAKPSLIDSSELVIAELAAQRAKCEAQSKKWEREREEDERNAIESQKNTDSQIKAALSLESIPPNYFGGVSNALCSTNGYSHRDSIDLTKSPGWEKLITSEREVLTNLAYQYLLEGDIPKTKLNSFILSTAYALHLLYSQRSDLFKQLDKMVWERVAGELIKVSDIGRDAYMDVLLDALSQEAPDVACDALVARTAEEIESGVCSSVQRWGQRLSRLQAQKLLELCSNEGISSKGRFTLLTQIVKTSQRELCEDHIRNLFDLQSDTPPETEMNLHLSLAFKLMPEEYGARIISWLEGNEVWGKQWVTNVMGSWESPLSAGILACSVHLIAQYYIWLHRNYPKSTRPEHDGVYNPSTLDNIHQLKNHLINRIIDRGETGSAEALMTVYTKFPEDHWLKNCIILAHQSECSSSLISLTIEEVKELILNGTKKRILHSSKDLLEAVKSWIGDYQQFLSGDNPAIGDLWHTHDSIRPKDEESLSDHLARFLELRSPSDLLINREVQIRRKQFKDGDAGSRTDLWIHVIHPTTKQIITLCIEVKCSWNDSSKTAIEEQLLKKYLTGGTATAGILLLGWYSCSNWDAADNRRTKSSKNWPDKSTTEQELDNQASQFSTPSIPIAARIVDCSIT